MTGVYIKSVLNILYNFGTLKQDGTKLLIIKIRKDII